MALFFWVDPRDFTVPLEHRIPHVHLKFEPNRAKNGREMAQKPKNRAIFGLFWLGLVWVVGDSDFFARNLVVLIKTDPRMYHTPKPSPGSPEKRPKNSKKWPFLA